MRNGYQLCWGRERGTLRGSLRRRLLDPVDHHPGLQIAPDQPEDLAVVHLARHPRHQHIELNPVEEPVQVLAASLFCDVAVALRENGSATLDEHCCYVRRPD
jgi:hypothetical protein